MSGFDLSELLPFYLDETDEQIAALNDALLKLEQDPSDQAVLREAFRMIHSIKGSSTVMGFDQVKSLTHHLENYFEELRSGQRTLERSILDLSFRCLDGLRDFHRQLRSGGEITADLSGLTADVKKALAGEEPGPEPADEPAEMESVSGAAVEPPAADEPTTAVPAEETPRVLVTVVLAPGLPWPDMKAKLVLNRLATKGHILATDPTVEQIEAAETLRSFRVWVGGEADAEALRAEADVEGVDEIRVEAASVIPGPAVPAAEPEPEVGPVPEPEVEQPAARPPSTPEHIPEPAAKKAATPPPTAAPASAPKRVAETLRVDVDRLDSLMNLAGELVINRAWFHEIAQGLGELFRDSNARLLAADTEDRLESLGRELDGFANGAGHSEASASAAVARWAAQVRRLRDNFAEIRRELDLVRQGRERVTALSEAIHQLARVTDGLQRGVLDTRMVPIGPLFERFHRVVRDLRMSSGKEVALRIEGEKTELDKRMIDELGDPLIHMVRNSVDHGLETPAEREAAGKSRSGTVLLQASHRGNSVLITVSDDGRGIDVERIRRKVVERGLAGDDEASVMTDRQLVQYIWHPGLSTAEAVTDISGRGVGMDIVKARIEGLTGTVDVRTEHGAGTTFTIRLPLTLAIMPCLLVRIAEEVYAIPLDHIDEIVEVVDSQVFTVRGRRMIEMRGRLVSLVSLDDVLTWAGRPRCAAKADTPGGKQTVVVAQNGDATIGLAVDQLIGMQEVVLKSLEKNFRPVPSLSGASILGDGRVSLILDIDAVVTMVAAQTARPSA
jgi:two-component system chemotaxis sensor kinase CheA